MVCTPPRLTVNVLICRPPKLTIGVLIRRPPKSTVNVMIYRALRLSARVWQWFADHPGTHTSRRIKSAADERVNTAS